MHWLCSLRLRAGLVYKMKKCQKCLCQSCGKISSIKPPFLSKNREKFRWYLKNTCPTSIGDPTIQRQRDSAGYLLESQESEDELSWEPIWLASWSAGQASLSIRRNGSGSTEDHSRLLLISQWRMSLSSHFICPGHRRDISLVDTGRNRQLGGWFGFFRLLPGEKWSFRCWL